MKFLYITAVSISAIFLFSGCSSTGQQFQIFDKSSNSVSTVYFYRPDKSLLSLRSFNIMQMNIEEERGFGAILKSWKLKNNSYLKDNLMPGKYYLTSNWLFEPKVFILKAGETACIKMNITSSDIIAKHPDLILVDKENCYSEIKETKMMTEEDINSIF